MSKNFFIEGPTPGSAVPVMKLRGRLEAAGAQDLLQQATATRDQGETNLILDLSEVEFLASSGLGTLLLLTEDYQGAGGTLVLVSLPPAVREVVNLLNLDQFLQIAASVEKGIEHATVGTN